MLDPFALLVQHCWGHTRPYTHDLQGRMGRIVTTIHCRSQPCWELFICTPLPTRTQQLTTLLGQQCWELFVPLHVDLHCYAGWEPVNCWQVFPNQKRTLQAVMGDSKGTLLLCWTHADSSSPTGKGCVNGKETFEELSHLCFQNLELKGISEETNKKQQRPHARRTTSLCSEFPFLIFKFVDHRKTTGKQWKEKKRLLKW